MGQRGIGIVLTDKGESTLRDRIPVNSSLCATGLQGSFRIESDKFVRGNLFVISVYALTDCSPNAQKDQFYDALADLVRKNKGSGVVVLASAFSTQVRKRSPSDICLGGVGALPVRHKNYGDRPIQMDNLLFLSNRNFRHSL